MLKHEEMIENVHRRIAQYEEEKKMKHSKIKNIILAKKPNNSEGEYTEIVSGTEKISSSNRMIRMVSTIAAGAVLVTGIGATEFLLHKNNSNRSAPSEDEVIFTDIAETSVTTETATITEAAEVTELVLTDDDSVSIFADFKQIYFNFTDYSNQMQQYSSDTYENIAQYLDSFDWGEGKEIQENDIPNMKNKKEGYLICWEEGILYYKLFILDNGKVYYSTEQCQPDGEDGSGRVYYYPVIECSVFDIDYDTFDKNIKNILSRDVPYSDKKLSQRELKRLSQGEFMYGELQTDKTDIPISLIPANDKAAQAKQDFIKDFPSMLYKDNNYHFDSDNRAYKLVRYFKSSENTTRRETYYIDDKGNVNLCSYELLGEEHIPAGTEDFYIDINEFETKLKAALSVKEDDTTATRTTIMETTTVETQIVAETESQTEQITDTQAEEHENETVRNQADEELVRAFYASQHNGSYGSFDGKYEAIDENGNMVDYKDEVSFLIHRAEVLPVNRELGSISDEQDAINKGRDLLLNLRGQEYIDYHEREYIEYNGVKEKVYRDDSLYIATYYEDYDIWIFYPTLFSGKTESGRSIASPGSVPYFYIRGCDGKILAAFN